MIAALVIMAMGAASAPVSTLRAALGGQNFAVSVAAGGAAVLSDPSSGAHLTTVSSSFSLPGPIWQNFTASEAADALGWRVTVDRSRAARGQWTVTGVGSAYRVVRLYSLDPPPPVKPRRLLVNDTISTPAHLAAPAASACGARPSAADVLGLAVRHQATVAETAAGEHDRLQAPFLAAFHTPMALWPRRGHGGYSWGLRQLAVLDAREPGGSMRRRLRRSGGEAHQQRATRRVRQPDHRRQQLRGGAGRAG